MVAVDLEGGAHRSWGRSRGRELVLEPTALGASKIKAAAKSGEPRGLHSSRAATDTMHTAMEQLGKGGGVHL
ncbi:hypothetical protein E2562_006327 [Oryza meyeriana var. granulata]|uniref:Uncharacterized protein n=1 Tax=Oryza meyeriana var. granulata TaxID=110450 RepID=A0A6G1EFQ7_9ORYZ|nr:hypothetical protein E2562_006327 [Oryza meyeriana var. granulata]